MSRKDTKTLNYIRYICKFANWNKKFCTAGHGWFWGSTTLSVGLQQAGQRRSGRSCWVQVDIS